ncbi:MAG TPA: carboxypeptidase-like regulatory domain-containing protein [Bryobacteraceae bacterium]|nr:carboxypeptidase-like regulatory domain-containing protein [Bryobacteraceae bacterium]
MKKTFWAIALLSAATAFAAVDGTVTNRTTGKPQPGATVTLYKLGQQNGLESIESVKSDAQGHFRINQDLQGPRLLQTAYDGVTYNHMLPPGAASTGVQLEVYNSSKQPGDAKVAQHMVLVEPVRGQLVVSEAYIFRNEGQTTYFDLANGTLRFYLPPAANGAVQVNATAPQGMPIRQAADKTTTRNVYKVAFPIKPGETRIDLGYTLPFTDGGTFEGKVLYTGGPTRLVAPNGVTIKGENVVPLGQEPQTKASIFDVKTNDFKVDISGTGSLGAGNENADDESGPGFEQIPPKVLSSMKWILLLAFSILGLGFILLYRAQTPEQARAAAETKPHSPAKEKNGRRRR